MDRVLNMLGLCARAGKLITGEKACVQAIRTGGAFAAVLDGAAAQNAVKAVTQACESHGVSLTMFNKIMHGLKKTTAKDGIAPPPEH